MSRFFGVGMTALVIVMMRVVTASAQPATFTVTVQDPLGTAIVAAEATLTGGGLASRTRTSGDDGVVTFDGVQPGAFVLRVSAPGFTPTVQDVEVAAGGARVTVALRLSGLTESVAVVGTAPLSGSKNEITLGRLNGSARVATGQELLAAGVRSVDELERIIPEIKVNTRSSRNYANITVRGISSPNFYSPSVAVYVDGVPQDVSYLTQDLWNVERVELLKGPQGTLFGMNAVGGVLNVVTRKPTQAPTGQVSFRGGDLGKNGSAMIGGPLSKRHALFGDLVIARGRRTTGLTAFDNARPGLDQAHSTFGRATVRYAPADRPFEAGLSYTRDIYDSSEYVFVRDTDLPNRVYRGATFLAEPSIERHVGTTAFNASYDFGRVKLTSVTAYQDRTFHRTTDSNLLLDEDQATLSEEVRLNYRDGRVNAVTGLYLQRLDFEGRTVFGGGPQVGTHDVNTVAVFGDVSYLLTPSVDASVGLRASRDSASIDFARAAATPLAFRSSDTFTNVSPRFTVGFQQPNGLRVYGAVSMGNKPGMFNRFVLSGGDATAVRPETSWNYEVGAKSALVDRTLWLDVSSYWIETTDGQFYVLLPEFQLQVLRNAGAVRSKGIDADLRWDTPLAGLQLTLGTAFNDATFLEFRDGAGNDYSGNRVPYAPRRRVALGASYTFSTPLGPVAPRLYLSQVSGHFFNEANTSGEDGYTLADLLVDWNVTRHASVNVAVQNLTDEFYRVFRSSATRNQLGPARNLWVGVRVGF